MSAVDRAAAVLTEALGERLQRRVPLGPMTTYRVGGPAALFVDVASLADLEAIARARRETGVKVLVVGRGSNMLVADSGFDGLAASIVGFASEIALPAVLPPLGSEVVVGAGGGVALPVLARRTAAAGISGFEWAVGVPGSVGGAVRMNAGGHGSDIASSLIDVGVFDLDDGQRRALTAAEVGLRFRASDLAPGHVVIDARLALVVGDRDSALAEIDEIVRWRRANQPGGQNCGSVFVNPVPGEVTAGALVDGLGLRGLRVGTAWVSEKHANFMQASEDGSADDVRRLMDEVRRRVAAATGYVLRSEVRLVGFDDADPLDFSDPVTGHDASTTPGAR